MTQRALHQPIGILLILFTLLPELAGAQIFDEDMDWQVVPTSQLRQEPYTAPTPMNLPGGARITTLQLKSLIDTGSPPLLIDVASGDGHLTLQDAYWLPGAGRGSNYIDEVQAALLRFLGEVTQGARDRSLIFFCVNVQCWLSYNAALRAIAAGYSSVYWYRGGLAAWKGAGFPLVPMRPVP